MADVIYRKYRPSSFEQVIGQEHVTSVLEEQLKKDSLSHAYLFTGSRGTGKTTVARIFANRINGIENTTENLDIIEIDAASNRGIDDIRELRDKITYAPSKSKYKIYIIDEVHMLTKEAFNALLKTLEEPPKHVVFIFATTEPHKIPITILSRVTRFDFRLGTVDSLKQKFEYILKKEKIKHDSEALDILVKHSKGSFRDGESLLSKVISGLDSRELTVNDINNIIGLVDSDVIKLFIKYFEEYNVENSVMLLSQLKTEGKNLDIVFSQVVIELEGILIGQINKIQSASKTEMKMGRIIEVINKLCKASNESKNDVVYGLSYELALVELNNIDKQSITSSAKIDRRQTNASKENDKLDKREVPESKENKSVASKIKENNGGERSKRAVKETPHLSERIGKLKDLNWRDFVKKISEEHFKLAALLINTNLINHGGDSLLIEVPYAYYKKKLESKELKVTLEESLKKECETERLVIEFKHNPDLRKKTDDIKKKSSTNQDIVEEIFNI